LKPIYWVLNHAVWTVTCTFHYRPWTGSIKPSLQYFTILPCWAFFRDSIFLYLKFFIVFQTVFCCLVFHLHLFLFLSKPTYNIDMASKIIWCILFTYYYPTIFYLFWEGGKLWLRIQRHESFDKNDLVHYNFNRNIVGFLYYLITIATSCFTKG
jgi:heme/copper-type cytochrome/quinol oxidase subunit 4